MIYVLDQLTDISRDYLDLVIRKIKVGERRQVQQFPRDSAEIVALEMDGTKLRESTRRIENRELGTN